MEINEIYNRDAFELLKSVENESADLIILDPNYQDWDKFCENGIIDLALSKLKEEGNLIMFTKKPYDFNLRNIIEPYYRNEIIWKYIKTGNWVSNKLPTYSYQKIYWANKSKNNFFNPRTGMPYSPNTQQGNKGYLVFDGYKEKSKPFENSKEGIWLNDFLHIERKREGEGKIPTKPIELCQILIRCFCPKNGLVIDPFCGGGNIPKVAKCEVVNFIAGDLDEYCFNYTKDKLKECGGLF